MLVEVEAVRRRGVLVGFDSEDRGEATAVRESTCHSSAAGEEVHESVHGLAIHNAIVRSRSDESPCRATAL